MLTIKAEYIEYITDCKNRTHKFSLGIQNYKKLRKKLYKQCRDIAVYEHFDKYDKYTPIIIRLKNSDYDSYKNKFYLDKRGHIRPLGTTDYFYNWNYSELLKIYEAGLINGNPDTIQIKFPKGLGDGEVFEIIKQTIISSSITIAIKVVYKIASMLTKDLYYKRFIRTKITEELFTEIINHKDKWNLNELEKLFAFTKEETILLLSKNNYSLVGKTWVRTKNKKQ